MADFEVSPDVHPVRIAMRRLVCSILPSAQRKEDQWAKVVTGSLAAAYSLLDVPSTIYPGMRERERDRWRFCQLDCCAYVHNEKREMSANVLPIFDVRVNIDQGVLKKKN